MSWANIGPFQLLIILAIILLLFGGKKLPDLAHALGKSMGEFKKGRKEGEDEADKIVKDIADSAKAEEIPSAKVDGIEAPAAEKTEAK